MRPRPSSSSCRRTCGTARRSNGFDSTVQKIASLSISFGKPVLLIEGDSHVFKVDNPFAMGDPVHGVIDAGAEPDAHRGARVDHGAAVRVGPPSRRSRGDAAVQLDAQPPLTTFKFVS